MDKMPGAIHPSKKSEKKNEDQALIDVPKTSNPKNDVRRATSLPNHPPPQFANRSNPQSARAQTSSLSAANKNQHRKDTHADLQKPSPKPPPLTTHNPTAEAMNKSPSNSRNSTKPESQANNDNPPTWDQPTNNPFLEDPRIWDWINQIPSFTAEPNIPSPPRAAPHFESLTLSPSQIGAMNASESAAESKESTAIYPSGDPDDGMFVMEP